MSMPKERTDEVDYPSDMNVRIMALLDHVKNQVESVLQTMKRTKGSGGLRICYATGARPGFPKNLQERWDPTTTSLVMVIAVRGRQTLKLFWI